MLPRRGYRSFAGVRRVTRWLDLLARAGVRLLARSFLRLFVIETFLRWDKSISISTLVLFVRAERARPSAGSFARAGGRSFVRHRDLLIVLG